MVRASVSKEKDHARRPSLILSYWRHLFFSHNLVQESSDLTGVSWAIFINGNWTGVTLKNSWFHLSFLSNKRDPLHYYILLWKWNKRAFFPQISSWRCLKESEWISGAVELEWWYSCSADFCGSSFFFGMGWKRSRPDSRLAHHHFRWSRSILWRRRDSPSLGWMFWSISARNVSVIPGLLRSAISKAALSSSMGSGPECGWCRWLGEDEDDEELLESMPA